MITSRSWDAARGYVLPPLAAGAALALMRRREALIPLTAAAGLLAFFRDPRRPLDPVPGLVYAAADGVVTSAGPAQAPWLPGTQFLRVSTFLGLHNVHVVRSPLTGTVMDRTSLAGKFRPALHAAAAGNRQDRLTIAGPTSAAGVILIAGALARRISPWAAPGDPVAPGTRLGLIHFGSRVDVLLPAADYELLVTPGAHVTAARTPVARARVAAAQPAAHRPSREAACSTG